VSEGLKAMGIGGYQPNFCAEIKGVTCSLPSYSLEVVSVVSCSVGILVRQFRHFWSLNLSIFVALWRLAPIFLTLKVSFISRVLASLRCCNFVYAISLVLRTSAFWVIFALFYCFITMSLCTVLLFYECLLEGGPL